MNKVTYYLFGTEACNEIQNSGINIALEHVRKSGMSFDMFKFDPSENTPTELLCAYDGWFEFMEISQSTYSSLSLILKGE